MSDLNKKLLQGFVDRPPITPEEAAELVRIAESVANWHQVSKALCDKENATLGEVLQAASQVKVELETVKRERDAAVGSIGEYRFCGDCKHIDTSKADEPCRTCLNDETASKGEWEWRGVCPENTEVQDDD